MQEYRTQINTILNELITNLEDHFNSDIIFYYGTIHPGIKRLFRDFIEELKDESEHNRLTVFLNTSGGSVEAVDDFVNIIRYHYEEVYFVVPDYAMSAGTIFCMSGDKIFMDYSSSLGPIDPQIYNGERYVPALNYLDKVDELIEKAKNNKLTDPEFVMLQNLDLAQLKSYEQARDLTVDLLKEWLVKYKFKSWEKHQTNPDKKGEEVTREEKEQRAKEIAEALNNTQKWRSHNRSVDIKDLEEIRLKVQDFSDDNNLRKMIREYNDLLIDYINNENYKHFMHSKKFF